MAEHRSSRDHDREHRDQTERQLRELAGAGRSQLSQGSAMRARDADQPDAAELAQAERDLILHRRHWKPDR